MPFGHVAYRVTPDLSVGLAITSPFGLATYYGPGWAGRYQAEKSDLRTIDFNPAVAYRIGTTRALFGASAVTRTLG